jgi:hypothetical protein
MKTQTNSVAAHFDDWLIVDPNASTPTGKIYDHYKEWCSSGLKAVSHIKYPKMLSELCNDYLELTSVQWEKHRGRAFLKDCDSEVKATRKHQHTQIYCNLASQNQK